MQDMATGDVDSAAAKLADPEYKPLGQEQLRAMLATNAPSPLTAIGVRTSTTLGRLPCPDQVRAMPHKWGLSAECGMKNAIWARLRQRLSDKRKDGA